MKEELQKFMELVKTDESLQKKLEEAAKNYDGEQNEEAIFNSIVAPIAKEAGFSLTLEDLKPSPQALNPDEMSQVAGGVDVGGGIGAFSCMTGGFGIGYGGGPGVGGVCLFVGFGTGGIICYTAGATAPEEEISPPVKR